MAQPARPRAAARRRLPVVAVLGALAAASAAPANAQAMFDGPAYAFPVPDYVSGLIGASALQTTAGLDGGSATRRAAGRRGRRAAPRRPRRPTAAQRRTLRFRPVPSVTAKIHDLVVERTGADRATVVPEFERVTADWRRVMARKVGWRPRDLGDVAAFAFVQGYGIVHGVATFDKRGLARIRAAVGDNLAADARVRRLSDARKQEAAESLELRTIFFAADVATLEERGDDAGAAAQRSELRGWLRAVYGVDVAKVRVTRRGLVRR